MSTIRTVAAYMTIGHFDTVAWLEHVVETAFPSIDIDLEAYDRSAQRYLPAHKDADNDGLSNLEEWEQTQDCAAFAVNALNGVKNINYMPSGGNMLGQGGGSGSSGCEGDPILLDFFTPPGSCLSFTASVDGASAGMNSPVNAGLGAEIEVSVTDDPANGCAFSHWMAGDTLATYSREYSEKFLLMGDAVTVFPVSKSGGRLIVGQDPSYVVTTSEGGQAHWEGNVLVGPPGTAVGLSARPAPGITGKHIEEWQWKANLNDIFIHHTAGNSICIPLSGRAWPVLVDDVPNEDPLPVYQFTAGCGEGGVVHVGRESLASPVYMPAVGVNDPSTVVFCSASPNPGWEFYKWSGDPDPVGCTMGNAVKETSLTSSPASAQFRPAREFTLDIEMQTQDEEGNATTDSGGSVEVDSPAKYYTLHGEDCEPTILHLEAKPSPGYAFVGWDGDTGGGAANTSLTLAMDADRAVKPTFKKIKVDLQFCRYLGSGAEDWVNDIDVVSTDVVRTRNVDDSNSYTFAWDVDEEVNADATDADRDNNDELNDDTNLSGREVSIDAYADSRIHAKREHEINLNVSTCANELYGHDQGKIILHDALIVRQSEFIKGEEGLYENDYFYLFSSNGANVLKENGYYTTEYLNGYSKSVFEKEGSYHNIFIFTGHGRAGQVPYGIQIDQLGTSFEASDIIIGRKKFRTPSNQERAYKFVLLLCCESYHSDIINAWNTQSFIGTTAKITASHAEDFDERFWGYIDSGINTEDACSSANYDIRNNVYSDSASIVHFGANISLIKTPE